MCKLAFGSDVDTTQDTTSQLDFGVSALNEHPEGSLLTAVSCQNVGEIARHDLPHARDPRHAETRKSPAPARRTSYSQHHPRRRQRRRQSTMRECEEDRRDFLRAFIFLVRVDGPGFGESARGYSPGGRQHDAQTAGEAGEREHGAADGDAAALLPPVLLVEWVLPSR